MFILNPYIFAPTSTLNTGLVSVYKAESNANDSFGTNNGTAIGGLTYTTGKSGNSFTYNGSNAYVQLPNNSLNFTTDFSISLWVNLVGVSNVEPLVNNFKQFNSNYYGYLLFVYNSNLYFRICDGVSSNVYDITTAFTSTSTWKHIVITRKRSVITKVYIDGILITSANTVNQGYESTMQYARIGGYNDLSGDRVLSNGSKVDEVGLWTKELTSTEVTELYRCGSGSFYPYISLPSLDSDACAFIGAASITDSTQQNAINQLVIDLKTANIWTKMKAIYPFVGGTALTHKYNLKNPNLYNLDFFGGGTHSSNGYQLDGATSYANTNLPDSFPLNDFHFSMYSRTNQASEKWDFGALNSTTGTVIGAKGGFTEFRAYIQGTSQVANIYNPNTEGYYIATRYLNGNNIALYKNNAQVFNSGKTIVGNSNNNYYIGGYNDNNGTPILGSSKELALVSIGYGLNSTEATAFYNAVQTFNTTLGRQV